MWDNVEINCQLLLLYNCCINNVLINVLIAPYMEATEPSVPILLVKFKSSLRKCYDRQDDLVDRYGISVSHL
jgi:hypothetical protein